VGPLLLYATLLAFVGDSQPLRDGLGWSAAMLVPAVAWLTRSALTRRARRRPAPASPWREARTARTSPRW
jgi:hypothetical protein